MSNSATNSNAANSPAFSATDDDATDAHANDATMVPDANIATKLGAAINYNRARPLRRDP